MVDKGKCKLCKEPATVIHHITYFPQKTIPVCKKCHNKIHREKNPNYIKYKQDDPTEFYRRKREAERVAENYLRKKKWGNRHRNIRKR